MRKKPLLGLTILALSGAAHADVPQEILDEYDKMFDPTYADSDFSKVQEDKRKQGMDEYEAFALMYKQDGILSKSVLNL